MLVESRRLPGVKIFDGQYIAERVTALAQTILDATQESFRERYPDEMLDPPRLVFIEYGREGDDIRDTSVMPYETAIRNGANKLGIGVEIYRYSPSTRLKDLEEMIAMTNEIPGTHATIVVRSGADNDQALSQLDPRRDVDLLNPKTEKMGIYPQPTGTAGALILDRLAGNASLDMKTPGFHIALIGLGKVGLYFARMLRKSRIAVTGWDKDDSRAGITGANVIVTSLPDRPGSQVAVNGDQVRHTGYVLMDIGTGGSTREVQEKAAVYVPSQVGVGKVSRSLVMLNIATAYSNYYFPDTHC